VRVDALPKANGKVVAGHTDYEKKTIQYVDEGPEETRNTFWHELTHAILYEMGKPELNHEGFVSKFADFWSTAIDSAKFE